MTSCSWNSYIDILTSYSDTYAKSAIHKACVIGLDGTKWSGDSHPNSLQPSIIECKILATCFRVKSFELFYTGVKIESKLYCLEKSESGQPLYLNGKGNGIIMQATHKAIVMGLCTESGKETAKTIVTHVVDYMKSYDC